MQRCGGIAGDGAGTGKADAVFHFLLAQNTFFAFGKRGKHALHFDTAFAAGVVACTGQGKGGNILLQQLADQLPFLCRDSDGMLAGADT